MMICSKCGLDIHPAETGLRHNPRPCHSENRCLELLQMKISALQEKLRETADVLHRHHELGHPAPEDNFPLGNCPICTVETFTGMADLLANKRQAEPLILTRSQIERMKDLLSATIAPPWSQDRAFGFGTSLVRGEYCIVCEVRSPDSATANEHAELIALLRNAAAELISAWENRPANSHISTYGELYAETPASAERIAPHVWDNMTTSDQRDWCVRRIAQLEAMFETYRRAYRSLRVKTGEIIALLDEPRLKEHS